MAGIGFELKKLYKQGGGITRTVGAMGYSTMTAVGSTLLIVGALIVTSLLMSYWGVGEYEKNLFAGCVLYCFVFSLILTSVFDTVLSRYVSDCIFSDQEQKLLPAVQGATAIFAVIFGLVGGVFGAMLYFIGDLDAYYVLMVYLLLMGVGLTFGISVFVTAIKAYRRITFSYLFGSLLILLTGAACRFALHMPIGHSMITGFAAGFLSIAVQLYFFLHLAFPRGDKSYFSFFRSVRANKLLLLSGLFYSLGLYAHNAVFWLDSDLQVIVARIIHCAPAYDMASFVAMLTSVTSMVVFVVRVETSFYREYKGYCESVIGNNLKNIELSREKMSRTLVNEVYFIGEFQIIITIVLMCVGITFLPALGISGVTLDIYPILALGYYAVFIMHLLMIFLYYFDDQRGAAFVGFIFFALTLICTLISQRMGIAYYGLGLVVSGVIGWSVAFIRLRRVMHRVDDIMFCDNVKRGAADAVS